MTFKLWSGESLWSNIAGILEAKHPPVSVSADARLGTDGAHPASAPPPRHQPRDRNLWQATPRCLLTWQITRWQTWQIGNNYKITTHNSIYKLVKHKVKHTLSEHQLFKLQPQINYYLIDKSISKQVARYLNPPNFQFPLVSDVMVLLRIYSRWKFLFEPA